MNTCKRIIFVLIISMGSIGNVAAKQTEPYTYVIVHVATSGGWHWDLVDKALTTNGHKVYRPTLTGLGERAHLASPNINLSTHIEDIVNVILFERLHKVILVGHSYGGSVITGVMNRLPERIQHAFFLDATVPDHGMSFIDAFGPIPFPVVGGLVHFPWVDLNSPYPRGIPQSLKTFSEPVSFDDPKAMAIPATYIAFVSPNEGLEQHIASASIKRASARNWTILTLNSDHNAHRSHPQKLAKMLQKLGQKK